MSGERDIAHPPALQTLKRATAALIRAFGGQEAAARHLERSQSRLADYGNVHTPDFIPAHAVMALEGATHGTPGHPQVTRLLAAEAGYLLVARPAALPADADWCPALVAAVAEFADVQERIILALPGGVTAAELRAADVRGQIARAQEKLAQLDQLAARALEGE